MVVNHVSHCRPGDRWDGFVLTITHDVAWADAEWQIALRLTPRGPVVCHLTHTVTVDGDVVTVEAHLPGENTAVLKTGRTYYGEVMVRIPSATVGAEPEWGPYTVFTFSLEATDRPQGEPGDYAITWSEAQAVTVTINTGGLDGADGAGFELGDPTYIHPTSRKEYWYVGGLYYEVTTVLRNGIPTKVPTDSGIATPV